MTEEQTMTNQETADSQSGQAAAKQTTAYEWGLTGRHMVSAGAGTGKTYNIQILFLRLILKNVNVSRILVVTFTRFATAELQERLRGILQNAEKVCVDSLRMLEQGQTPDVVRAALAEEKAYEQVLPLVLIEKPVEDDGSHLVLSPAAEDMDQLRKKLGWIRQALRDFDSAPISTIHGFSSRMLRENAFESGLRYGLEPRTTVKALLKASVCGFLREFCADEGHPHRRQWLKMLEMTPKTLLAKLGKIFDNPQTPVFWGEPLDELYETLLPENERPQAADLRRQIAEALKAWQEALRTEDQAELCTVDKEWREKLADLRKQWLELCGKVDLRVYRTQIMDSCNRIDDGLEQVLEPLRHLTGPLSETQRGQFARDGQGIDRMNAGPAKLISAEKCQQYRNAGEHLLYVFGSYKPDKIGETRQSWCGNHTQIYCLTQDVDKVFEAYHGVLKRKNRFETLVLWLAWDYCQRRVAEAKEHEGFITYDDMLLKLRDALEDSDMGPHLQEVIQRQYDCALVDECQDNDPVQSAIFEKLFGGDNNRLFYMIGDSKQAIYKFRGGDVPTFLAAEREVKRRNEDYFHELNTNYRASTEYIEAMNDFFGAQAFSFSQENIYFQKIESPKDNPKQFTVPKWQEEKPVQNDIADGQEDEDDTSAEVPADDDDNDVAPACHTEMVERKGKVLSCCVIKERRNVNIQQQLKTRLAEDIRRLVQLSALTDCLQITEKKDEDNRPVSYKDIAVLVTRNSDGRQYASYLQSQGIPAVVMQDAEAFGGDEAWWLQLMLDAILNPSDSRRAVRSLGTPLMGLTMEKLEYLQERQGISQFQTFLKTLNELWRKKSFLVMFEKLMYTPIDKMMPCLQTAQAKEENTFGPSPAECLAAQGAAGGLSLASLQQQAEILQATGLNRHLGQLGLYRFLCESMPKTQEGKNSYGKSDDSTQTIDEQEEDDNSQKRLGTQAPAVKILTIHKSKGLEYPLVIVPLMKLEEKMDSKPCVCHVGDQRVVCMDAKAKDLQKQSCNENNAEYRRQLYVAITRARYACRLIFAGEEPDFFTAFKEDDWLGMKNISLPENIKLPKPEPSVQAENGAPKSSELHSGWFQASFSMLCKAARENANENPEQTPGQAVAPEYAADETAEAAEYADAQARLRNDDDWDDDQENEDTWEDRVVRQSAASSTDATDDAEEIRAQWLTVPFEERLPIFAFPGGTRTGTCWHEIFENLDFSCGLDNNRLDSEGRYSQYTQAKEIEDRLDHYGQLGRKDTNNPSPTRQERLQAFLNMVQNICSRQLEQPHGDCVQLKDVDSAHCLHEFNFTYRLPRDVEGPDLVALLDQYHVPHPATWSHKIIGGWALTGSIDLLFEARGKYYIIDWKTNLMGGNPVNYDVDSDAWKSNLKGVTEVTEANGMAWEMGNHFYHLQYLIYTVAFIQYYQQLNPAWEFTRENYETLFGGCFYLFVRGFGAYGTEGPKPANGQAVFANRPDYELVKKLSEYIGTATAKDVK